ncbi:MAG: TatD family hydrolase [Chloroflexi bacterium]|nr:TatD family hydrolase [Chloroflexota bacterium]
MLIDTHTHLHFDAFDADRPQVVRRAQEAGVIAWIDPAVDLDGARRALTWAHRYPDAYFVAVGVHPNSAHTAWHGEATLRALRTLANDPAVVAIGEIGLDYYREATPPPLQRQALQAQLDLAAELGLPVILHQRESIADLLAILADWVADLRAHGHPLAEAPGVLHSFSAGPSEALRGVELGFFIGLTGPLTFKNGHRMRAVARAVPLNHLLVETDAPFMAPHPYRGRRNEPAYVRWIAQRLAQERGLPFETVAAQTTANAQRLFRLPLRPTEPPTSPQADPGSPSEEDDHEPRHLGP